MFYEALTQNKIWWKTLNLNQTIFDYTPLGVFNDTI